ncbi:GTP-binding protein HflX [Candidatus Kryptonium thompsonii]|uniref:GTPase HflX n=1 Tax=Candidatus Kryptonium thompsonii TaxID=1633631 RepID=UPI0007071CCB|nr:GTPase HflX [Candidatus Kryptonium thompsoni]CUS80962.1 GTP-binding protein HflX [Candidatus Kryptonium thompsoni]CUS83660.1 GTP-binding protein HflX [Candidatus Kryptonium thompsoni]CUS87402.1 GTP-binding protein HflX [Candidatus Kryptonium thompsoni]CUS92032.1 GTP-binding protein HflX [Candidatus Kryptonium thompsoni]CUS96701.1 GTP-binding protein HflX [Candidatus Kryptonium thompsoni]
MANYDRERERAVIVGVIFPHQTRAQVEEYLDELELLADTAGADVVCRVYQERDKPDPAFFIGRGKAEQIAKIVEEEKIDLVIFDDDLSGVQIRNLENIINCKIIDRTTLILDIFASHARTAPAKIQVELAQLEYLLPRLTGKWRHLSKQYGGIGTKGPGETQLETDRRLIKRKIAILRRKLGEIDNQRKVQRKGRRDIFRVALVGYTNAGKSTLLNVMANTNVYVEDKLFATLDATTRVIKFSPTKKVLLTDTVGFIRKLPHHLIASFKSTLDEIIEADILIHVVDISAPNFREQIKVVEETLEELNSLDKPTIIAFNKIDKLQDRSIIHTLAKEYENAVFISASRGVNIQALKDKILQLIDDHYVEITGKVNVSNPEAMSIIYKLGEVLDVKYDDDNYITLRVKVEKRHLPKISAYILT